MLFLPDSWRRGRSEAAVFAELAALEGKIFRDKDGRRTLKFRRDGRSYFIKFYRGIGWPKLVKSLLTLRQLPVSTARPEWEAIRRLTDSGIPTMKLVGYGSCGWNPANRQSFVITEELENTVSLEDFCRPWPRRPPAPGLKRALLREVARITRAMHAGGLNHRDLYICHFLLQLDDCGRPAWREKHPLLYLIDLHRVQQRQAVPKRWRVKDLASLYFSSLDLGLGRRDIAFFLRCYYQAPLRTIFNREKTTLRRVAAKTRQLYGKLNRQPPRLPL